MSLLFDSEGYFCEGEIEKDWQFKMEFGRIMLTNQNLSFIKKSNISLTKTTTTNNNFNEGYNIPLLNINKVLNIKKEKIYVIIIETTDGYIFSITMAEYKSSGKNKSIELTELLNQRISKNF